MRDVVALLLDDSMPATRQGELLRAARKRRGWKRAQAADAAGISTKRLKAYESGTKALPTDVCARLAECYGESLSVPSRVPVHADDDWLIVGAYEQPLMSGTSEEVVAGYVKIVQRLRGLKPGEALELRANDMSVLAQALGGDAEEIARHIALTLGCSRDEARALHTDLLRRKVLVPVASLAAGVVAIAGVAAATHADASQPTAPAPPAASATVLTLRPIETTESTQLHARIAATPTTTALVSVPDTAVEHPQVEAAAPPAPIEPVAVAPAALPSPPPQISHAEAMISHEGPISEPPDDVGVLPGEEPDVVVTPP